MSRMYSVLSTVQKKHMMYKHSAVFNGSKTHLICWGHLIMQILDFIALNLHCKVLYVT